MSTRLRRSALAGAMTLTLAIGGVWVATRPSSAGQLVLGEVVSGEISQTLTGAGTIEALGERSTSFPVEATVTSVLATVGDEVTAGQILATIDDTSLRRAQAEAELAVAEAEQELKEAETAAEEEESGTGSTTTGSSGPGSSGTTSNGSTTPSTPAPAPSATATASSPAATPSASPTAGAPGGQDSPSGEESEDAEAAALTRRLEQAREAQTQGWRNLTAALTTAVTTCVTASGSGAETEPEEGTKPEKDGTADPTAETAAFVQADTTGEAAPEPTETPSPGASLEPSEEPTAGEGTSSEPTPSPGETPSSPPDEEPSTSPYSDDCITALDTLGPAESAVTAAQDELNAAIDAMVTWAGTTGPSSPSEPAETQTSPSGGTTTPSSPSGTSNSTQAPSSSTGSSATGSSGGTDSPTTDGLGSSASGMSPSSGSASSSTGTGAGGGTGMGGTPTVAQAEAALAEATLALTAAALDLDRATLVAPVDGVLTAMPFVEGQQAGAGDIATVMPVGGVALPLEVGQSDIAGIAIGQAATITSATGDTSEGAVSAIAILPTLSGSSATWTVTVAIAEPGVGLAVGTAATTVVTVASASDAVLAPISAVTLTGTDSGTVRVLADGSSTEREVSVGIRGTTHVEITDGLESGDQVVLSDPSQAIPASTSSTLRDPGLSTIAGGGRGGPPR